MKGASEAWGSLRTQERRQAPGDPQAPVGQAGWKRGCDGCSRVRGQVRSAEERGCPAGDRPPFSGSRALAEGLRFRLRQGRLERASVPSPKGVQGQCKHLRTAIGCSSKTRSQADTKGCHCASGGKGEAELLGDGWRGPVPDPKIRLVGRGGLACGSSGFGGSTPHVT